MRANKAVTQVTRPIPSIPQDLSPDGGLRSYLTELHGLLRAVVTGHNTLADLSQRDQRIESYISQTANGLPDLTLQVFNVKYDAGKVARKVDGTKASWAIKFGDTTDQMLILYSPPLEDPITWETFLSVNNTGIPVDGTDIVRLVDLFSTASYAFMQATPPVASFNKRLDEIEQRVNSLTQGVSMAQVRKEVDDLRAEVEAIPRGVSRAELQKELDNLQALVAMGGL